MTAEPEEPLQSWIRALPKAEVHLHLEGCVPPALVDANGPDGGRDRPRLPVSDLAALLAYLDWSCARVRDRGQLAQIAYAIMTRAAANGARHVDVIANPTHWPAFSGRLDDFVQGLDDGFAAAEQDDLGTATLCLSLKRTQSAGEANDLVSWILAHRDGRVSALSLDGDEQGGAASHTARFAPAFARAAAAGVRRCVHAGESSGAPGVRAAIDALHAERVDHGIRSVEDPALVRELADRAIPLDICPSSNVRLGVVSSLEAHPVERLRRAGVRISLNTDDPLLFGIDLLGEYRRSATIFAWDTAVLHDLARTSIESCFAPPERRARLLTELDDFTARKLR